MSEDAKVMIILSPFEEGRCLGSDKLIFVKFSLLLMAIYSNRTISYSTPRKRSPYKAHIGAIQIIRKAFKVFWFLTIDQLFDWKVGRQKLVFALGIIEHPSPYYM